MKSRRRKEERENLRGLRKHGGEEWIGSESGRRQSERVFGHSG